MKILFISYNYWPPHFGGELKICIERFQSLINRGHTVTVLTSGVPDMPREEIVDWMTIKRSPIVHDSRAGRGFRRLYFPLWVFSQMKGLRVDIIHFGSMGSIGPVSNFLGMNLINLEAKLKGVKTVIVHNLADTEDEMFSNKGVIKKLRNLYLKRMDSIISVSPALHDAVRKFYPENARLITNCVRDDIFLPLNTPERDQFRKENGISDENLVFSFLGSVSKRKGFDLLLTAFRETQDYFPDGHLWVIGPKDVNENQNMVDEELKELIRSTETLHHKIKFWGRIENRSKLAKILSSSDIFVFPTRKEGMPLAPMEAMSAGVPLIISRIPGVTDLASIEGSTGLYIDVNDVEALKTAMIQLGTNATLRHSMGEAAHQRIKESFGWAKHINEWESLYTSLIDKRKGEY